MDKNEILNNITTLKNSLDLITKTNITDYEEFNKMKVKYDIIELQIKSLRRQLELIDIEKNIKQEANAPNTEAPCETC